MSTQLTGIVVGFTTGGFPIHLPLTLEIRSRMDRKDAAETLASYESLFQRSVDNPEILIGVFKADSIRETIFMLESIISSMEARTILQTQSFDEFLRYGSRLLFNEFKVL